MPAAGRVGGCQRSNVEDTPEPPPPPLPSAEAPLPPQLLSQWRGTFRPPEWYLRCHLFVHALAFYVVAASMWLQPDRYAADRWRGLMFLVSWATPGQWAAVFAVLATLKLAAGLFYPRVAQAALIGGIIVLTWWVVGFGFAYVDSDATIVPAVVTALDLAEHYVAASMLDGRRRWRYR
jgi:hypothetical protein